MGDWGTEEKVTWSGDENDDFDSAPDLVTRCASLISAGDFEGLITVIDTSPVRLDDFQFDPIRAQLQNAPTQSAHKILARVQVTGGVGQSDDDIRSALFEFAEFGKQKYLNILFKFSVNPNLTDSGGNSAIHLANHVETLKTFREAKADLFIRNKKGQSPVHVAAWRNKGRIVSF